MRCFLLSALFMLFSLVLVTPAFASDETANQKSQTGEIIYEDDEIKVVDFGNDPEISEAIFDHPDSEVNGAKIDIVPFSSVNGPGGRSSIVASNTGRSVYWSVKPATLWPYHFSGVVKLRYHSGFKRDAPVGSMGALGQTVSGGVTMKKNNGGVAYLSGTAYALSRDKYRVLPGVNTSFRPN
ncbi:hypothetical protein GW626_16740 [Peribacillus muralis]|uniref:hypothetical protein n=2 Tax=Peribacillus muralis TaxID=264697 RepID=UPI000A416E95|nr:hypothetical protein [Peribacillus muralis]MCK2012555.1 hypothetical protein [Peribacillus muralis]